MSITSFRCMVIGNVCLTLIMLGWRCSVNYVFSVDSASAGRRLAIYTEQVTTLGARPGRDLTDTTGRQGSPMHATGRCDNVHTLLHNYVTPLSTGAL